jgi:hypothetical protein
MVGAAPRALRTKGNSFAAALPYLKRRFGEEAFRRVLAGLKDPESAQLLAEGVRRNGWYPFAWLTDFYESLERSLGKGDGALVRDMNRELAREDLGTILKAFIAIFGHPHDIVQRASTLWGLYYDAGELAVTEQTPNSVRLELRSFPAAHRLHCASVLGWMIGCIGATRVRTPKVEHTRCRLDGAPVCEFVATWS